MKKIIKTRQLHRGLRHVDVHLDNAERDIVNGNTDDAWASIKLARQIIRIHMTNDLKRVRKDDR